jgi:diguanylate cyclase (GGDEF)-like protein
MNISEIMNPKVLTIVQDQPVSEAADLMRKHNVGGLVVLDSQGAMVGIVTSRDLRGVADNAIVGDIMSKDLTVVHPKTSIWAALETMNSARVERLPVVAADKLIGIVTRADLLTTIARHTDSLTNLYSAAFLRDMAYRLIQTVNEICIIFIDIDDFGSINKLLGHSEGDRCLRVLSGLLRQFCNPGQDFPCRFGGDEFAVVSTRSLTATSHWVMEFKAAVENACIAVPLTISIGIAGGQRRVPRAGVNMTEVVENLINLASLASTRAKETSVGIKVADDKTMLLN